MGQALRSPRPTVTSAPTRGVGPPAARGKRINVETEAVYIVA